MIGPFALFMIALLFLVAGLLTRPSLGARVEGVLRPTGYYDSGCRSLCSLRPVASAHVRAVATRSARRPDRTGRSSSTRAHLDTGPLWFVGVLLIFSLGYAAWVRLGRRIAAIAGPTPTSRCISAGARNHSTAACYWPRGGGCDDVSGTARLPLGRKLHRPQLVGVAACIALFALGIAASRQGWLIAVRTGSAGNAAHPLIAAGATVALVFIAGQLGA